MKYLFGDTDLAARRLRLLARVYKPSTQAFLRNAVETSPGLAIDLGCGPGYTTQLVAQETQARHTVGLDSSPAFVAEANANAAPNLTFYRHNVRHTPLPAAPAGLIFARYLLAHLEAPESLARGWISQLAPGGRLLLEEVEQIETDVRVFTHYLGIVERMLAASGSDLYVGRILAGLCPAGDARLVHNRLRRIPVSNQDAAKMFSMNIVNWGTNDFIRTNYATGEIIELELALSRIAEGGPASGTILWKQRQVAFEKA